MTDGLILTSLPEMCIITYNLNFNIYSNIRIRNYLLNQYKRRKKKGKEKEHRSDVLLEFLLHHIKQYYNIYPLGLIHIQSWEERGRGFAMPFYTCLFLFHYSYTPIIT
jgi:hypothetical protein